MKRSRKVNRIQLLATSDSANNRPSCLERLEDRTLLAAPEIVSATPAPNSFAPASMPLEIEFDQPITLESAREGVAVYGSQHADVLRNAPIETNGNRVVIDPFQDFFAGEKVRVIAADGLTNAAGESLATPRAWEYTAATAPSSGTFTAGPESFPLGTYYSRMGDVNGDGSLDAVVIQALPLDKYLMHVYSNNGQGRLSHVKEYDAFRGQQFEMGDLDGDGDLDLFSAAAGPTNAGGTTNWIWFNDGQGNFTVSERLGYAYFYDVALGDVDADGDLDVFSTGWASSQPPQEKSHRLWINDGAANFIASDQDFGGIYDGIVEFGDYDGDGDLDLVLNRYVPDSQVFGARIWWNDGRGTFVDSGQQIGRKHFTSVSTGDVNGDGAIDLFFSVNMCCSVPEPSELYLNDGEGRFELAATTFLPNFSRNATLGDIDGDQDLDVIVTGYYDLNTDVYRNDGTGYFTLDADALPSTELIRHVSLGDLDGDRDLDMIVAGPTPVWINKNADANVSLVIEDGVTSVRRGEVVTYKLTVRNSGPAIVDVLPLRQTVSDDLTDVTWTSVVRDGAVAAAQGVGAVNDTLRLPVRASVTYTLRARVSENAVGHVGTAASLALPARFWDPTRLDHAVNDVNAIAVDFERGRSLFPNRELLTETDGRFRATDIDLDGDLDFLVLDGATLLVQRNDGLQGFVEILNEHVSSDADLDVGDVDRDGDVDAIVSSGLWLNDGHGNFARTDLGETFATASAFADLNADGWLDVYAGGRPNRPASIYLNDGAGRLIRQAQRYDAETLSDVEAGDMDGDGDVDLLAIFRPYQQSPYARLLFNDGVGRILEIAGLPQEINSGAKIGDLDGDGDLDIVSGTASRMIWINNGDGFFAWNQQSFPSPSVSGRPAIADWDGDGDLDVYLGRRVFRNDGAGNFELASQFTSSQIHEGAFVDVADFDHDGDADLLAAFNGISIYRNFEGVSDLSVTITETTASVVPGEVVSANVRVFNHGSDLMRAIVRMPLGVGVMAMSWTSQPTEGAIATPSGVGAIGDAVVVPAGGSITYVVAATTDPRLIGSLTLRATASTGEESPQEYADPISINNADSDAATVQITPVSRPGGQFFDTAQRLGDDGMPSVALGDLDGDGDLDALAVETNRGARVWRNNGAGRFSAKDDFFGASSLVMARIADLDGDQDLDAFLVGFGNVNGVWINNGAGEFEQRAATLPNAQSIAVALGDLDGDSDVDAYVVNTDGQPDHVYWNDGMASLVDSGLRNGAESGLSVQLGDMDGDADLDAIVTNVGSRFVELWTNNGASGFVRSTTTLANEVTGRLAIGDLDNDGDLDFAVPDRAGISVATNSGGGTFLGFSRAIPGQQQAVALSDLDGNGRLDIYVVKGGPFTGEPDTIFLNQGGGNFVRDPQLLGNSAGLDVALGDLDRDGDTDAFVANGRLLVGEASEIWRNGQQAGDTFPYDGVVDLSDLNRVRNNFGASGIAVEGDGNGDGQVDLTDLNLVRNNFGAGSSPNQSNIPPGVPAVHLPKPPYAAVDALFYQLATNDRMNKNPLNRLTTNRGVALQRHELR